MLGNTLGAKGSNKWRQVIVCLVPITSRYANRLARAYPKVVRLWPVEKLNRSAFILECPRGNRAMVAAAWKTMGNISAGKIVVGLTALSFFMSGIGMPLPAPRFKDKSVAFPCQDHACGCGSAEQCWQHCCCFTVQERWAWAWDHSIAPPAYAEQLPGQEADSGNEAHVQCCHHQASHRSPSGFQAIKVCGFSALHCRGLATLWTGAAAAVPPSLVSLWSPSLLPIGWIYPSDFSTQTILINPLDPPPR